MPIVYMSIQTSILSCEYYHRYYVCPSHSLPPSLPPSLLPLSLPPFLPGIFCGLSGGSPTAGVSGAAGHVSHISTPPHRGSRST